MVICWKLRTRALRTLRISGEEAVISRSVGMNGPGPQRYCTHVGSALHSGIAVAEERRRGRRRGRPEARSTAGVVAAREEIDVLAMPSQIRKGPRDANRAGLICACAA